MRPKKEKTEFIPQQELPPHLVEYFKEQESKINELKSKEAKKKELFYASHEEYDKEYWENNEYELRKCPKSVGSHLTPIYPEAPRNMETAKAEKGLSVEEKATLRQMGEEDMYIFAIRYFGHYLKKPSSELHRFLYSYFSEQFGKQQEAQGLRTAIAAPRGSAKSSIASCILPLWCICYGKKKVILLISDTADQAHDFLEDIKAELETNELIRQDFPKIFGKGTTWRRDKIRTKNGVTILALGTGNKVRGRRYQEGRPSLVVCDDLEGPDSVRSLADRNFIRFQWFDKDLLFVGADEPVDIIVVGTVLGPDSLLNNLLDPKEYPLFTSFRFKAVKKFSTSPLWDEWRKILTDRFNPTRKEDAYAFYKEHEEEMLEGTEVLWPEGDPYYNLMMEKLSNPSGFNCFKGDTPILINNFYTKKIKELNIGDTVISDNGLPEKISYINKRYTNEKIVKIKIAGWPDEIEVTWDHPFLVWSKVNYKCYSSLTHDHLDFNKCKYSHRKTLRARIENNLPIWKNAIDIKVTDAVIQPLPKFKVQPHLCDEDLWWMVGLYLAEGYINYNNNVINISVHRKEKYLLEKFKKICIKYNYGNTITINDVSRNACTLTLCSKKLVDFFKDFGRYSHGKFLPEYIKGLCEKCFTSLLNGYLSGDGYLINHGKKEYPAVNSASRLMLEQFRTILLNFGCISYLYKSRKPGIGSITPGKTFKAKQLWSLQLVGKNKNNSRVGQSWIYNNLLYSKIQRISIQENSNNLVYGISVTGNKTYCIPNAIVHNCEKQNDPIDPSAILVMKEDLTFQNFQDSDVQAILRNCQFYGCLDPSLGKKNSKGDYSCICTIAREPKSGYIYVVNFDLKRRDVDSQIDAIINNNYEYNYSLFGVEADAFQYVVAENLRKKSRELGVYIPVKEVYRANTGDKKLRFEGIVPLILDGTIIFDEYSYHNDPEYNHAIEMITTFTGIGDKEDDANDALEGAVSMVQKPRFRLLVRSTR